MKRRLLEKDICRQGSWRGLSKPRKRETQYTQRRFRALELVGKEDEHVTVPIVLGVRRRMAQRFIRGVRSGDLSVLDHGNLGRLRYPQAFDVLSSILAAAPKGTVLRCELARQYLIERGLKAPTAQTIRRWQRELLGIRQRVQRRPRKRKWRGRRE